MLEPDNRLLLIDNLRPPVGYSLDCAVGTTYSLDLMALMTAPVAFAMFDRQNEEGALAADAIAALEALRRHARHITLFCQAGQIAVPAEYRSLLVYLEDSVFQVTPRQPSRVFHPKVWFIRYRAPGGETVLRMLCLSRNLTFDRSWDTVLRLDGVPGEIERYPELREFGEALLAMAEGDRLVPEARQAEIRGLVAEFARAEWSLPDGFDTVRFHPLGHDGETRWPFPRPRSRVLIVSPFVTGGCLEQLSVGATHASVISRAEALDAIGQAGTQTINECLVLDPDAGNLPEDQSHNSEVEEGAVGIGTRLQGLHAKTVIYDNTGEDGQPWKSSLWTGSANATDAAFHGNVEFLVQMDGAWGKVGVSSVIEGIPVPQQIQSGRLRRILMPYSPPAGPLPPDPEELLEQHLDAIRRAIGSLKLTAQCQRVEDNRWRLDVLGLPVNHLLTVVDLDDVLATIRPLSLSREHAQPLEVSAEGIAADVTLFEPSVTPWFVITLALGKTQIAFVVRVDLIGAPAGREDAVLAGLLNDRATLIRFLLLLMGSVEEAMAAFDPTGEGIGSWGTGAGMESIALLEPLLRTAAREPERLRDIGQIMSSLASRPESLAVIPEEWAVVWDPIQIAMGLGDPS